MAINCTQFYLIFALSRFELSSEIFSIRCRVCPAITLFIAWKDKMFVWIVHCQTMNRWIMHRDIEKPEKCKTTSKKVKGNTVEINDEINFTGGYVNDYSLILESYNQKMSILKSVAPNENKSLELHVMWRYSSNISCGSLNWKTFRQIGSNN